MFITKKITDLDSKTIPAGADVIPIIDTSDTGMGPSGSNKKITISSLKSVLVDLASTQTLTNKTLTSPKIGTAIADKDGNEIIKTPATASAVNEITITNAATGNNPSITATGDNTNIDLEIGGKGTGKLIATSGIINKIRCDLYKGDEQSIPTAGFTAILFNNSAYELYDPMDMHSVTTNTERINISIAGIYKVNASLVFVDSSTETARLLGIKCSNGKGFTARGGVDGVGRWGMSAFMIFRCAANDYIYMDAYQVSGGGTLNANGFCLSVELVGV